MDILPLVVILISSDSELSLMDNPNFEIDLATNTGILSAQINHLSMQTKTRNIYNEDGVSLGEFTIVVDLVRLNAQ